MVAFSLCPSQLKPSVMTFQSFKSLTNKQKRKALLQQGVFLADRTTSSFSIFLFHMGDFFVELFFIKENDEVVGLRPLKRLRNTSQYNFSQLHSASAA